jgi:hypothetical protein
MFLSFLARCVFPYIKRKIVICNQFWQFKNVVYKKKINCNFFLQMIVFLLLDTIFLCNIGVTIKGYNKGVDNH